MPTPVQSGYAPVNGVEIYYEVHGQGTPIVLLHGGLMSASSFAPIIGTLTENHQVIGRPAGAWPYSAVRAADEL